MSRYDSQPSISGSKSTLYPDQITFSEKKSVSKKVFAGLVGFLTIVCLVFFVLFIVFLTKYNEEKDKVIDVNEPSVTGDHDDVKSCFELNCVKTAAMVSDYLDLKTDPCEDFAQFACGNFYETSVIPDDKTSISSFSKLSDDNLQFQRQILERETTEDDVDHIKKLKAIYKSCIDEDAIEDLGIQPYLDGVYKDDFPTLNPNWDESSFDLNNLIIKYLEVYVEPLITYYIFTHSKYPDINTVYVVQPSLGLSEKYFKRERNDSVIEAYQTYIEEFMIEIGADPTTAKQDARDVVDFEIDLAQIIIPQEQLRDFEALYNPMTLEDMNRNFSGIDYKGALQAAFRTAGVQLEDNFTVINEHVAFYEKLHGVVTNTSKRVVQNLFGWRYASSSLGSLTKALREIRLKFNKARYGVTEEKKRWKTCTSWAGSKMQESLENQFVLQIFSRNAKTFMDEMIEYLKASFKGILDEITWMSPATKAKAYQKLNKMTSKIGYPEKVFNDTYINDKYSMVAVSENNYYQNRLNFFQQENIRGIQKLNKPVDKTEWFMASYLVNAYYAWATNEIVFPAGILQPPFYSENFPPSMNFGSIGAVIGHEITHGFDDMGRQYDKDGILDDWWEPQDATKFKNKVQCVIDEFGSYLVPEINTTLNGINTQGENVADMGGLKEAYRAFKDYQMRHGTERMLPGLNFTSDQLFFVSYAHSWCVKTKKESLLSQVLNGVHAPGQYRIQGPLKHSKEFSAAFKCPVGSPMNPKDKCVVW